MLCISFGITFQAIHYKCKTTNDYIKQLMDSMEKPQLLHFRTIKSLHKRNSDLICRINSTFSLVMSAFFAVLLVGLIQDAFTTFAMILANMSSAKSFEQSDSVMESESHFSESVRCISADILVMAIKLCLIAITISHMIAVNDESRATVVNINDFVTQFHNEVQTNTYHSVSEHQLY